MRISLLQLLGLCLAASSSMAFVSVPMRGPRAGGKTSNIPTSHLSMTASLSGGSLERSMGYTATGFGKPDNKIHNKKKKKTKDVRHVAPTPEQQEELLVLESPPLQATEQEQSQWDVFSSRLRESDVIRAAQEALKQSEMVLAYQQHQHDVVAEEEDSEAVLQDCVAATSVPEEVQAPVAAQEEAQAAAAAVENTHFLPDVRPSTIAGAAIAGALASSLLLGNNDSVLVAASAACYLSICRGAAGDVARSLGEVTWACTKMTFDLFQELISPAPSSDVGVNEETTPARL